MGGDVPSNTTQTQTSMPSPIVMAGQQKYLDQVNKYEKARRAYKPYGGMQVADFAPEWYQSRALANQAASRLAATGGLMSIRGYADGGTTGTTGTTGTPTDTGGASTYQQAEDETQTGAGMAYGYANTGQPGQIESDYTGAYYTPAAINNQAIQAMGVDAERISGAPVATQSMGSIKDVTGADAAVAQIDPNNAAYYAANPLLWNQQFAQRYADPYMQGVVSIAQREAERQYNAQKVAEQAAAAQSGALGGYRQGVTQAEAARNYGQLQNDIVTKGAEAAYQNAQSQFNMDVQNLMATGQFNAKQAAQIASQNLDASQAANLQNAKFAQEAGLANQQTQYNVGQSNLTAAQAAEQLRSQQAQAAALANQNYGFQAATANQQQSLEAQRQNAANNLRAQEIAEQSRQFGFTGTQESQKAANDAAMAAAQNNITNAFNAKRLGLDAINTGLGGARQLADIESQYQAGLLNTSNANNTIAQQQMARNQALIDAAINNWNSIQGSTIEGNVLNALAGLWSTQGGTLVDKKTVA